MSRVPAVVLALSVSAFAADNEVSDTPPTEGEPAPQRCAPAIQCAATLAAADDVEVSAGSDGRTGDGQLVHDGQMVVKYTLSDAVEVDFYSNALYLPGATPRSSDGLQPGLKLSVQPESASFPSADLELFITVPTWNLDQTWDFEAWWCFSKTAGPLRTDLNFMFAVADFNATQQAHGMATLTLNADLGHGLGLFAEGWATFGQTQALPPGLGVFAGLSFAATDELSFDVGSELAFHEDQRIITAFAGFTFVPQGQRAPQPSPGAASIPTAIAMLDSY